MSKYKIKECRDGFSVWKLKDFGNGYAWEDTKRHFRSMKEAQDFINSEKEEGNR